MENHSVPLLSLLLLAKKKQQADTGVGRHGMNGKAWPRVVDEIDGNEQRLTTIMVLTRCFHCSRSNAYQVLYNSSTTTALVQCHINISYYNMLVERRLDHHMEIRLYTEIRVYVPDCCSRHHVTFCDEVPRTNCVSKNKTKNVTHLVPSGLLLFPATPRKTK